MPYVLDDMFWRDPRFPFLGFHFERDDIINGYDELIGPGVVFGVDPDFVVKMPIQHIIPEHPTYKEDGRYLASSLMSMEGMARAAEVTRRLIWQPHDNIARTLRIGDADCCLFVERLTPLTEAWSRSNPGRRRQWAKQLAEALEMLEIMGFHPTGVQLPRMGIDATGRLKLFNFCHVHRWREFPHVPVIGYWPERWGDWRLLELTGEGGRPPPSSLVLGKKNRLHGIHAELASALHYILSGVDPCPLIFYPAEEGETRLERQTRLREGRYEVAHPARILADILREGWRGDKTMRLVDFREQLIACLGPIDESDLPPPLDAAHYDALTARARDWLAAQRKDPDWLSYQEYVDRCEDKDVSVDEPRTPPALKGMDDESGSDGDH